MKKPLFFLLSVSLLCPFLAAAQDPEPFVPQHEFRLEAGAFPVTPYSTIFGEDFWDQTWNHYLGSTCYRGAVRTTGAIGVSYGYRALKWLDIGATVSYVGYYGNYYDSVQGDKSVAKLDVHYVTMMPFVRFNWCRRPLYRVYSSVEIGARWAHEKQYTDAYENDVLATGQVTFVGISVGRKFFGFAELGTGARGSLIGGVGFRFDAGTKKHK